MQEPIRISLSKGKIALRTFGAFLFVSACCWMWYAAGSRTTRFNPELLRAVALVGMVFFGLIAAFGFLKLTDSTPGLLIDEKGIQDNSSAFGKYFIPWENVLRLKSEQVKSTHFLLLFIKNPEEVLSQASRFQRFWMRQNHKLYGTPVSISAAVLQCDFKTLATIIHAGFELNREPHGINNPSPEL
jgi:hypothetical protein